MNAYNRSQPGWLDRLAAFLDCRGTTVALVFGAVVLLAGIGSTGLWEPWEMDRADLARTLAAPPEAIGAFAKDSGAGGSRTAGPAEQALARAAAQEGLLLKLPEAGTPSSLRAALDLARTRTTAAVVIDGRLLLPDATRDELWKQAGKLTAEALGYAAGASVVVVRDPSQPPAAELARRLAVERWKDVWETTAAAWSLDAAWDPKELDAVAKTLAAESPDPLIVLEAGDAAGLAAALDDGADAVSTRVAFKDSGRTVSLPPLETWLRAAAYRIFGPSELTTRLPGALLGIIALWVLLTTVRTVWSTRVAFFAGLVLATLPLFFAQSRIISGEPGAELALTLVACGLLLGTLAGRDQPGEAAPRVRVSPRLVWAYLIAGLVIALLAKGVYALALGGLLALALPLVSGSAKKLADWRQWAPAFMFLAAAGLVELAAKGAAPGSMWAGLDFQSAMFSDGPSVYSRTFDMVIKELGFGLAPWSPLVVVAMGLLVFSALEKKDRTGLIVVAWFFLPIVALMASLGVGNQFLFPATAAAAIAVALMLDKLVRGETGPKYFVALALVMMFYIMRRELKQTPEPLVGFLAFDPPFAKEGTLRFPETVEFFWGFKQSMIIAALACLVHFGGFARFAVRAARWLRNRGPYMITTGLLLFVASLLGLAVIGRLHGIGMSSRFAATIQTSQKALIGRMVGDDPMFIVGIELLLLAIVVIAFRWVFPGAGRAVSRRLPDLTTPRAQRYAWGATLLLWGAALLAAVLGVVTPADGYWGERLFSAPALTAYFGAALVALMVWSFDRPSIWALPDGALTVTPHAEGSRSAAFGGAEGSRSAAFGGAPRWWLTPALAAASALALILTTQLVRDASMDNRLVTLFVQLGFAAAAVAVVPRIVGRADLFIFSICALLALIVMSWVIPLVDRATLVTEIVMPEVTNPKSYGLRTLLQSEWFLGPILLVFALLVNRALPRLIASFPHLRTDFSERVSAFTDRVAERIERGKVLAVILLMVALVGVVTHLVKLEPAIAVNVSQKHIIDLWHQTAGEGAPIYKHGAFATQGRKDANFYTSSMPEIRDRQAALKVLLGREDQVLEVETATGTETLVFPGWNDDNDQNKDKRRDALAIRGFASAVGDSVLTDATQAWTPKSLVGKRLADAGGRTWSIVDNDVTSVRVAPEERLSFALVPRSRAAYTIDDARMAVGATADKLERRALLLPADQLSDLNYAFRLIADGRHLPVLDGSSYRVLLTTSWLEPSEPQQNRLALATLDDKSFAALKDPTLVREWGNFEDTIQIVGYATDKTTVTTGEMLKLTVYYKTLKLVKKSLKIFIHMDKTGGGARIAGDHWPLNPTRHTEENKNCGGCYRTDHWLVGDIVRDDYDIEIPEGNTGEYTIWLGLYQPGPDTRLTVKSWDQRRVKHDGQNRLGLGTIQVK